MEKFYITTAIDYVNSPPHVGTSYEKILADVMARWKRLLGSEVTFLMGNDEHSLNVEKKAIELGRDPLRYCDEMEAVFQNVWNKLHLSHDVFIRTTWPRHEHSCREIFRRIQKHGDIYRAPYKGRYCVGCEARKTDRDIVDGKCPNHPTTPLQWMEEENYFFALSRYAGQLKNLLDRSDFILPTFRTNEMLKVLEEGLEDISISRRRSRWGISIPEDPDQVMYVWFDALINYITGAGFPDDRTRFSNVWPADIHVIGKDITRFHCLIWPAMLMAAGIEPPKQVAVHGFVSVRGLKMSKSLGTVIDPAAVADAYGGDALRYYLLREIAFGQDGDFTWEKFFERYNRELANDLGNLLQRTVSMIHRYCGGAVAAASSPFSKDAPLKEKMLGLSDRIRPLMDRFEFHTALGEIFDSVRSTNTYLEETAPWTRNKEGRVEEAGAALKNAAEALRILSILLGPFIPISAQRIWNQLGLEAVLPFSRATLDLTRCWDYIQSGLTVPKPEPLFPRVEPPEEEKT